MTREEAIKKLQKQKAEYLEEWIDYGGVAEAYDMAIEALQDKPDGRWIMHIDDLFPEESTMECDQCHEEQPLTCDDKYCPNCGVKMGGAEE